MSNENLNNEARIGLSLLNVGLGSPFQQAVHHAYAKTDGTYAWPNSREGDMLREAKCEIEHLRAALKPFAEHPDFHAPECWPVTYIDIDHEIAGVTAGDFLRAKAAMPNVELTGSALLRSPR